MTLRIKTPPPETTPHTVSTNKQTNNSVFPFDINSPLFYDLHFLAISAVS